MTVAPLIWSQMASGRVMDLLSPDPSTIDLAHDIAGGLSRLARFAGQAPSGPYSVAQHCVMGADAIMEETGSPELARAFLLHDAHEGVMGDIITPTAAAIAALAGARMAKLLPQTEQQARALGEDITRKAISDLKRNLDRAIHCAASMDWPLSPVLATQVLHWDLRMLRLERDHLLAPPAFPWSAALEAIKPAPAPARGRIRVWPWPVAADAWRTRLYELFPHLKPAPIF